MDAQEQDMVIIDSPVGLPGRSVHNSFLEKVRQGKKKALQMPLSLPGHLQAEGKPLLASPPP